MKKAATLVAGLLLVTGTVFAEGFSYDFSGTNVEYTQSIYDSQDGTFVTKTGDSDVTVNFKLAKENTSVNFKTEFDDKDALTVGLTHSILDGMVEIAVAGDLNFGLPQGGLKASRNDSVWLKYKPKSVEGLTIGFFPYDLPFALEVDDLKLENGHDIPGVEVVYNAFTFRFGSRQVFADGVLGTNGASNTGTPANRFYGQASYNYSGEGFGFGGSLLFSTQDEKDVAWNQKITYGDAVARWALHLKGNANITDALAVEGEFLTGVSIVENADSGFATRVKGSYVLGETETPEGTLTTSTYAQVKYTDKGEGVAKFEVGAEAAINEISIKPNFSYTQKDGATNFDGEVVDATYQVGVTLAYSI